MWKTGQNYNLFTFCGMRSYFLCFFSRKSKQDHFVSAEFATALTLHNSKTQFLRLIILIFFIACFKINIFLPGRCLELRDSYKFADLGEPCRTAKN